MLVALFRLLYGALDFQLPNSTQTFPGKRTYTDTLVLYAVFCVYFTANVTHIGVLCSDFWANTMQIPAPFL